MLDVTLLRESPSVIASSLARRGIELDLGALADLDARRRQVRSRAEELRSEQKDLGGPIAGLDGPSRNSDGTTSSEADVMVQRSGSVVSSIVRTGPTNPGSVPTCGTSPIPSAS